MLDFDGLNFWAIIIAWFVNCAVGAIWYSPAGFAKQWKKHTGVDIMKIPTKEANNILGAVVASGLLQAFTLAVIINSLNVTEVIDAFWVGFLLWLGLTAATTVGATLYQRRNWNFWWINSRYFLIVMCVNSVILATWQ